ncbi:hypothetical protein GDO81_003953 [Engystomops pustulosus]|uniref:Uncharacterized protein n=1 Tax=Engystomops pustulosus TaxID=76066 RepID=A0AAV7A423_ENGPU|nr:hypothetical protein GDO81_003953 [Engystomops pustulosus]
MPRVGEVVWSHRVGGPSSHICADAAAPGKSFPHGGQAVRIEYLQIAQVNREFDLFLADGLVGDAFTAVSDLFRWVQEESRRFIVRAALAHAPAVLMLLVGGSIDGRTIG